MGTRALRAVTALALAAGAFALALVPACASERGRADIVVSRPVPSPTGYPGPAPVVDKRPIEQNPECWIADAGWPRCSELNDERTDTP